MLIKPTKLKVVGLDPSLRNWGFSIGEFDYSNQNHLLTINEVGVIQPILATGKQTRQNSLDLESAKQMYEGLIHHLKDAHAVFVEVPVGSQSARSMASYGICVGVLGAVRAMGIPFFEVTPTEVKLASTGKKLATKEEMISWATSSHPEANWPYYKENGVLVLSKAKAEHMADATGAIYAGLHSNPFKQLLSMIATTV